MRDCCGVLQESTPALYFTATDTFNIFTKMKVDFQDGDILSSSYINFDCSPPFTACI